MSISKHNIIMIIESILLAAALGLGTWWYIHNRVVLNVSRTFEDGSEYKGEWLAGKMHGSGLLILPDSTRYEGSFISGQKEGQGKLVHTDGSGYDGSWHKDLYHGQGKYLSKRGNVYEGEWKYGTLPYGTLITEDWTYEGDFDSMSPSGVGVTEYKDGSVYAGHWYKGYKQGLGRMMHPDGKVDFGFWDLGSLQSTGHKSFRTGRRAYGIDVSRHQKSWNWEDLALYANSNGRVFSSGRKTGSELQPPFFVIMKATEGSDMVDPYYASNVAQAREGRIIKGAYHFMTTLSDIETQVDNFIINAVVEKGDFPPVLDIETPHKRVEEVGVENIRKMALTWLRAVEEHYGVRPVIYTNNLFREMYLDTPEFSGYDFWIARYSDREPDSGEWLVWQFTQTGRTRGIAGGTDINIFNGSYADLKNYIGKAWGE